MRRDYQVLEPGTYLQVVIENTREPLARGLAGGRDGKPSAVVVRPETREETTLTDRISSFGPLTPDDVVSVRSGGGGGWGDPFERDPGAVAGEVREELLTPGEARDVYGVVLRPGNGDPAVDEAGTERLRARRGSRAEAPRR